ncbi:MAG: 30S ribosomal protein S16 [Bacteroidetes bacterium]|nr:30S ribosomal protein S16 [Bacteroidota bacterium]MBP6403372.1 30S ribosomal protein S16 [Bacteroidia bacterium]MBK9523372.1 30S ribosomal protein S16 [Bacteroidota bacterium]MBK9541115.1 30S ribosomal protein S16 [Bacteroidota bacterium]MBL0259009.1 30S ribosomal protein S16 [Bacteroidota bacterium]
MPVKIRLSRHGKKHQAYYHIVVADSRAPRDGKFIEVIGNYNPNTNPATIQIDNDKALTWLKKGAQPTDTCRAILSYKGVLLRSHLDKGITKGAITQEAADTKYQQWLETKNNKIEEKRTRLKNETVKERETRLADEGKKKEAKMESIRVKNTPPPVEAPSAPEGEAPSAEPTAEA